MITSYEYIIFVKAVYNDVSETFTTSFLHNWKFIDLERFQIIWKLKTISKVIELYKSSSESSRRLLNSSNNFILWRQFPLWKLFRFVFFRNGGFKSYFFIYLFLYFCFPKCILVCMVTYCANKMTHPVHTACSGAMFVCPSSVDMYDLQWKRKPIMYQKLDKTHPMWLGDYSHLTFRHRASNPGRINWKPVLSQLS